MATKQAKPVKQLRELLQEQQEPFILEIYLVERGYLRKRFNSQRNLSGCPGNSRNSLQESVGSGLKKSEKGSQNYFKVLKAVYNQVTSINDKVRNKSSSHREGKSVVFKQESKNNQEVTELDRFSSASSTTVFNSCSEDDTEETSTSLQKDASASQSFKVKNSIEKEAATDRNLHWQCIEDKQQLSPVSVLEYIPSHGGSPFQNNKNTEDLFTADDENNSKRVKFTKKITEDSLLSASLWKVLFNSPTEKQPMQEFVKSNNPFSQLPKSKTVVQQTKQLLFDCAREVAENPEKEEKQQQESREYLETKELGRLIGEKIKCWGKKYGNESNLTKLLEIDFLDSAQEWNRCTRQRRDIVLEIGDGILEEIRSEIVIDMIRCL